MNLIKFNKGKCKLVHLDLGRNSSRNMLGTTQLVSTSTGKDPGILVNTKLNMNHQNALATKKAKSIPVSCRSVASMSREEILPFCSALMRPHLWPPNTKETSAYWSQSNVEP